MAVLKNNLTGDKAVLRSHHVIGRRKAKVDTYINSSDVSQIHATIRWDGSAWTLQDHSKNGTWVDGKQVAANTNTELKFGTAIRFGGSEIGQWTVIDLGVPLAMLSAIHDNKNVVELNNILVLPSEKNPEITLYATAAGNWTVEKNGSCTILNDGDLIDDGVVQWQFFDAGVVDSTLEDGVVRSISLNDILLLFNVSLDEEHVTLDLERNESIVSLGERTHHYLLLTLARKRFEDIQNHVDTDNQGWVDLDLLSTMLGMDSNHINIQIFRLRKQFSEVLSDVNYLPQIVERRVGGVRLGCSRFKITKGSQIECDLISDNALNNKSA